jgi:hypothetical protein
LGRIQEANTNAEQESAFSRRDEIKGLTTAAARVATVAGADSTAQAAEQPDPGMP